MTVRLGIRARLMLLTAICLLPMLGLVWYDAWHASAEQIESARADLRGRAASSAAELNKNIQSAKQLLLSMSQMPDILNVDSSECATQLRLLAGPYAEVGNALGIKPDGDLVCSLTPNSERLNLADRDYVQKALASQEIVLGTPVLSRDGKRYILPVARAARAFDGEALAVMAVTINLTQFARDNAAGWRAEDGASVEWWDREGRVVFRWPDAAKWAGRSYADTPLGRQVMAQQSGYVDGPGIGGSDQVRWLAPLDAADLKITMGVPRDTLLAASHAALQRNLIALLVISLIGFGAAWLIGEALIRKPLARLAGVAERMRGGDFTARSIVAASRDGNANGGYTRSEVGVVARAFDSLADSLTDKISRLEASESLLRENLGRAEAAEHRVRQQLEHMNLLDEITRSIGERLDLQSIFMVVVRTLEDSLPVDFCCIALHDATSNGLRVERFGAKGQALAGELALGEAGVIPIDKNGLSRAMQGKLVYEPDIRDVKFPFPERLAKAGLCSLVLAPLFSESRVFGVLIAARREAHAFASVECEFLRQLSEHVALAAGQAQLHSALRQAYDDLRQTQQVVMQEERLRALGRMASGIAHDINNALSPVSLYAETLLERETAISPRGREYLETILRAVGDVAQTVARMREFYRQREIQLELAPVDLNQMVQQVLELTRARWHDMPLEKGVVIRAEADLMPALPKIMAVESEIREALTNLVFNAVDAMPEGGTLTLRTRLYKAPGVDKLSVAVEVMDEGVGMDEETRQRCLEPFFTTKGERGTGLGLAMVFGTMQRHNADMQVVSAPGAGTTMRLLFSIPSAATSRQASLPATNHPPTRMRLLLIDDDLVLLKSLRDALEADGHVVITATGGQEGIGTFTAALARGEHFDAVFTDLGMPHIDGRKVAVAVKAASPAMPVLLLTGWGQRMLADGEIPPGVDQVLAKPPKMREVRAALAKACGSGTVAE